MTESPWRELQDEQDKEKTEQEDHFFALLPNLGGDQLRELNPSEASKLHWALATALVVPPRPVLSEESDHELTISSFSPIQGLVKGYGQDYGQHDNAESTSTTITGTNVGLGCGLGLGFDGGTITKAGSGSTGGALGGGHGAGGDGGGSGYDGGFVSLDFGANNVLYEGLFVSLHEDLLLKLASFSPQELVDTAWAVAKLQRRLFHVTKLEDGLLAGVPTADFHADGRCVDSGANGAGSRGIDLGIGSIGGRSRKSGAIHLVLPRGDEVMDRIAFAITGHWDLTRFSSHQLTCLAWAFANWSGSSRTAATDSNNNPKGHGENYCDSAKATPTGCSDEEGGGEKAAGAGAGDRDGVGLGDRMEDVEEEIIDMEDGLLGDMDLLGGGSVGMTTARTELVQALGAEATKRLGELSSTRSDVYYAGACRQWVDIYLGAWARNGEKRQAVKSDRAKEILSEPAHIARRLFRIFSQQPVP